MISLDPISSIVAVAILAYFVVLAVISYRAIQNESSHDFSAGSHKVSFLGTWASLFVSTIDGVGFAFLVSLAAALGFGLYWFAIGIAAAALVHFLQAPRIKEIVKKHKYLTLNDMLESRIGKWTSFIALVAITILVIAHAASLLHISGVLFESVFGLNIAAWIVITALAVGLYLYAGGYKTVIKTDIVQFIAILVLLGTAIFIADFPSLSVIWEGFIAGDALSTFGTVLFFALLFYPLPAIWQRMFTAKDTQTLKKSLVAYVVTYVPIYFAIIVFGMTILSAFPGIDPNMVIYHLSDGIANPIFGLIISVSFIALTMSSIDTQAYLFLSTIASNWMRIDKEKEAERYRSVVRLMVIVTFLVITVIAITISDVISFIINALTVLTVLVPAVFFAVHNKEAHHTLDKAMFLAVLVGGIVYFYMLTQGLFTSFLMNAVPGVVAIVLGLIAWFCCKK